jgi:hypothetical protein
MVIRHKPASFPDEQSKMRYAFNRLRGVALGQILPQVREDGTIGLEDLPACIQLLQAAYGDPDRVATAERKMRKFKQMNPEFYQYYAEFLVNAADLNWNPSDFRNALRMGLSEEMKDSFTYSDMPEEIRAFLTLSQKWDNHIRQHRAEKAAQSKRSGQGFASPRPPPPPRVPEAAATGTVARYTGPAPMDLSAGKRRIWLMEGRRGLQMGGVYSVFGLTTGRRNVQQGKKLRHSRRVERRIRKEEPKKVPRNPEKIRST